MVLLHKVRLFINVDNFEYLSSYNVNEQIFTILSSSGINHVIRAVYMLDAELSVGSLTKIHPRLKLFRNLAT